MKSLKNQLNIITIILFTVLAAVLNISFGALSLQYSRQLHDSYCKKAESMYNKKIQTAYETSGNIFELMGTSEYSVDFSNNLLLQSSQKQAYAQNTIKRDLDLLNLPSSYIDGIYVIGKDSNQLNYAYYTDEKRMDSFVYGLDWNIFLKSGIISVIYRGGNMTFADSARLNSASSEFFAKNSGNGCEAMKRLMSEISGRVVCCDYIDSQLVVIAFDTEMLFGIDYASSAELELCVKDANGDTVYSNLESPHEPAYGADELKIGDFSVSLRNPSFATNYFALVIPFGSLILLLPLFIFCVTRITGLIVEPINSIARELESDEKRKISLKKIGRFSLKNRILIPLFSIFLAHYIVLVGVDFVCFSIMSGTQKHQITQIDKIIISDNTVKYFCQPSLIVPISLAEINKMSLNMDDYPEMGDVLKVGADKGYELEHLLIVDQKGNTLYRSKLLNSDIFRGLISYAIEQSQPQADNKFLIYSEGGEQYAFWVKSLTDADVLKGYMLAVIDPESFSMLVQDLDWIDILITDSRGDTVYSSISDSDMLANLENGGTTYIGNEKYEVYKTEYADFGWEISCIQPSYIADRLLNKFIKSIVTATVSVLVIMYFAIVVLSYYLTKNINALIDCMLATEKITIPKGLGSNELCYLADTYNQMLDRIGFLTEKLVKEEKRQENLRYLKAQSELSALKAQVNAHFIFNVLNIIHEDAVRNKNEIIKGIVESLSSMIRYSMAPEMLTTVRDELESVNRYIYIQKIRYGSHFEFCSEIEEGIEDLKILRLVIQPLVENAIEHGIFNMNGGRVYLNVYRNDIGLNICVTDDGIGMRKKKAEKLMEYIRATEEEAGKINSDHRFGIAIRNIYQRMKTYYGDTADMSIVTDFMNGTTVRLIIPMCEKGEEQE